MKPSEIIYELRELRKAWRKQSFSWTAEQKREYDRLTQLTPGSKIKFKPVELSEAEKLFKLYEIETENILNQIR